VIVYLVKSGHFGQTSPAPPTAKSVHGSESVGRGRACVVSEVRRALVVKVQKERRAAGSRPWWRRLQVRLLQVLLRLLLFVMLLLLLLLLIQGHGVSVGQSRPLPLVNPHRSHGSFSAGQTGGERCERCHGAAAANKSMGALSRKAADLTAPTTAGATADVAPPTAAAAATTAIAA
jgi:hypothetical protein